MNAPSLVYEPGLLTRTTAIGPPPPRRPIRAWGRRGVGGPLWISLLLLGAATTAHAAPTDSLAANGRWTPYQPFEMPENFSSIADYDSARDRVVVYNGATYVLSLSGEPRWTELLPSPQGSRPRTSYARAFDQARGDLYIIGGEQRDGVVSQVWRFSGERDVLELLHPIGPEPPALVYASAMFDPVRQRILVFGGNIGSDYGYLSSDVWALDLEPVPTWSLLTAAGSRPTARRYHSVAYDPARDRMLVYAGQDGGHYSGLNDLWSLSLDGTPTWSLLRPSGILPQASVAQIVYDPGADRLLLFDFNGPPDSAQVWAIALAGTARWTRVPASPSPSGFFGVVALDSRRHRVIVTESGYDPIRAHEFDLSRDTWSELGPWGVESPVLFGHAAVLDPVDRHLIVLFGRDGSYGSTRLPDLWETFLDDARGWRRMSVAGAPPPPGYSLSAVYDPRRRRIVTFGGDVGSTTFNEAWSLELGGPPFWRKIGTHGTPPPARRAHCAAYDPIEDRMIVFGGQSSSSGTVYQDLWSLSFGDSTWTPITATQPPAPRWGSSLNYDPAGDRFILFGGALSSGSALSQLYALSLRPTPTWTPLIAAGVTPTPVVNHSAVLDPLRQRILVYGGNRSYSGSATKEVWQLSLAPLLGWSQLLPSGPTPTARGNHVAVWDSVGDRMIALGGFSGVVQPDNAWSLTWKPLVAPDVRCPGALGVAPGSLVRATYVIDNHESANTEFDFVVSSSVPWPHLPFAGRTIAPGVGARAVDVWIPVPSDPSLLPSTLTFSAEVTAGGTESRSCSHSIGDPTTPVIAAFLRFESSLGRVRLVWTADGSRITATDATVDRRGQDGAWAELGHPASPEPDRLVYDDTAILPGRRYEYRLRVATASLEFVLGETIVDTPRPELALESAIGNPARGALGVRFTLATADPARIEVFDLAGRSAQRKDLAGLSVGTHLLSLGDGAWPAGIYWVRLTQGREARTLKTCLVR